MKIAVFIDYWNFQLTLNERVASRNGTASQRVQKLVPMLIWCPACSLYKPKEEKSFKLVFRHLELN